jgi:carbon monoxide dehydrogenase subunit G
MQLMNEFLMPAPLSAVWTVLTNPESAVNCMPGAALTEQSNGQTFKATVSLKVGPVKLQFSGDGLLANLAADHSYGEMTAKGSDSKGRGGFKTDMKFFLSEESGGTRIRVETELTLTGSVAQYGRGAGIVKEVAAQLTQEFTRNLQAKVAAISQSESISIQQADQPVTNDPVVAASDDPGTSLTASQPQAAPAINVPRLVMSALWGWLRGLLGRKP